MAYNVKIIRNTKYTVWETFKMFKYSNRKTQLPFGFKRSICCVHSASRNVHHALKRLKT